MGENRKNRCILDPTTGEELWSSRSSCVATFVIAFHDDEIYILLERRGNGKYAGKLGIVSGYLDYNETRRMACIREVFEETGLDISCHEILEWEVNDDPIGQIQNITTRYIVIGNYDTIITLIKNGIINNKSAERNGESGEVEEIVFLSQREIQKIDPQQFVYGSNNLLLKIDKGLIDTLREIDSLRITL